MSYRRAKQEKNGKADRFLLGDRGPWRRKKSSIQKGGRPGVSTRKYSMDYQKIMGSRSFGRWPGKGLHPKHHQKKKNPKKQTPDHPSSLCGPEDFWGKKTLESGGKDVGWNRATCGETQER